MIPLCVIVRHGNTFAPGETPRRIGVGTDLPLVDSGRAQALTLGKHFASRSWCFDRALISPLTRTRETAALILSCSAAVPPISEPQMWLAEIDHGPDENRNERDVLDRIGLRAIEDWDRLGVSPPGWRVDAETRKKAWRAFFAARPTGLTLLVTSNGAARFGLLADPGLLEQAAAMPSLKLATGAFGLIGLETAGPRLIAWNQRP